MSRVWKDDPCPRNTTSGVTRRYTVGNLTCGGCVARAETALCAVPGVLSAGVNLATRRADLLIGDGFDGAALTAAMDKAGYPVMPVDGRALRVSVGNLSCGGCAARAEAALTALPDVQEARVNLASKRAELAALGRRRPELGAVEAANGKAGYPRSRCWMRQPKPAAPPEPPPTRPAPSGPRGPSWPVALSLPVW